MSPLASPGLPTTVSTSGYARRAYNPQGQRSSTSTLDAQGRPTQTVHIDYDSAQRPIAWRRVRYQNGKPHSAQPLQRLEYPQDPDTLQPRLIAWPSVVPGREHQIRFTYNPAGQPTEITETGYEPIGQQPITRTTRYGYQDVAGH